MDVLEGLKQLDDESIDLIITSPPYNKVGLNGISASKGRNWKKTIDYNDNPHNDNMSEQDYQEWQTEVLKECYRVLKNDGSLFYNHKNRIHNGEIISPFTWLYKTPFKIRQEIIWDRGSGPNVSPCRYIPSYEHVFWLTKSMHPRFNRVTETQMKKDVWKMIPKKGTEHPAPFPMELPDNIIPCVAQGERITVLDPFMGSGTVAISAKKHGCDYIGFEKFQEYVNMANNALHFAF